jgi:hypothetical protein
VKPVPSGFNLRPILLIGRGFSLPEISQQAQESESSHDFSRNLLKQLENPCVEPRRAERSFNAK